MNPLTQYPLRKIAENQLTKYLGNLDDALMNDLATSLVRQWLTNDGHAGFVTPTRQWWFKIEISEGGSVGVGVCMPEGNWGRVLSQDWQVDEEKVPELLHQLNLCQSIRCQTVDGRPLRLWVEPKAQAVGCKEQSEDEGPEL